MKKANKVFPTRLDGFNTYVINVVAYLNTNKSRLKITDDNITVIVAILIAWTENYNLSADNNTSTKTTRMKRDAARKDITKALQAIYSDIPRSVLITQDYNTLGISPRDTKPSPAPKPGSAPVLSVNTITHLKHVIRCSNPATPKSTAKPDGVKSIQLLCAVADDVTPPPSEAYSVVAISGRGLIDVNFKSSQVGKFAFYKAMYINTRGEAGNASDIINGAIA